MTRYAFLNDDGSIDCISYPKPTEDETRPYVEVKDDVNADWIPDGKGGFKPPPVIIDPASIKMEARRRIEAEYPLWKQMNIVSVNGPEHAEMRAWIDGIRAASDKLENKPVADFTADKHWIVK